MTQVATASSVLGDFDDVVLEDRGFRYRFERRDDEIWVDIPDPLWFENPPWFMELLDENWPETPPQIEARVVMSTGSHHMQNYWIRRPDGGEGPLRFPLPSARCTRSYVLRVRPRSRDVPIGLRRPLRRMSGRLRQPTLGCYALRSQGPMIARVRP